MKSGQAHWQLPDALLVRLRLALALNRGAAGDMRYLIADLCNNRAVGLVRNGNPEAGLREFAAALDLVPDHPTALSNRGGTLTELGRVQEALADLDAVLAREPARASAWSNRGNALAQFGRFEEALASLNQALALNPGFLDARLNRGHVLECLRRFDAALADYDAVLADRPDEAGARYNASRIHLAQGDFARGWPMHEARWQLPGLREDWQDFPRPLLRDAADAAGRTVLLWAEQGLGDSLQFCRYASLFPPNTRVLLAVPPPLARLLRALPNVAQVVAPGERLPDFDLHCPLMSLPLAFGTRRDTVPGTVPYLHASPDAVALWRRRLAPLPGRPVGLVWAGNPRLHNPATRAIDRRRSIDPALLAPFGDLAGVSFVSLQKYATGAVPAAAPDGLTLHDWTAELADFADTAALVSALDLVITIDSAVAHLAGALGKPVWLLNRFDACWRWLDGRDDSPWYPTLRLFTQPAPGDWPAVIAAVVQALDQHKRPQRRRKRRLP